MLPIKILLLLFLIFGKSMTTAAQATDQPLGMESGAIKTSQIKATGISSNDLERLRYGCCTGETKESSGLCLAAPATIEIEFPYPTKVGGIVIQSPVDMTVGYVERVTISYKKDSADPQPTVYGQNMPTGLWRSSQNPSKSITNRLIEIQTTPTVKTLYLGIGTNSFPTGEKPCLRLEIKGCPQTDCPQLNENPVLTTTTDAANNEVTFTCSITPRPGFRHTATWFLGTHQIQQGFSDDENKVVDSIHQKVLYANLPPQSKKGLKCRVTVCNINDCTGTTSEGRDSNVLTPTATANPTKVDFTEGGKEQEIAITLSGPPVLFVDGTNAELFGTKYIRVEAEFATNSRKYTCAGTAVVVQHPGHKHAKNRECGPLVTEWTSPQKLAIKAVTDGLYIKETIKRKCTIYLRHFKENPDGTMSKIYDRVLASIDVEVTNRDGWAHLKISFGRSSIAGGCSSFNDPHIRTADGLDFEAQYQGEFIAYQKDNYQVNGYFVSCNDAAKIWNFKGQPTCNCGVAVKAADEVVVFSSCPSVSTRFEDSRVTKTKPKQNYFKVYTFINDKPADLNGKFRSGMRVFSKKDGTEYYVSLPSGTYVKVMAETSSGKNKELINFIIVNSISDRETSKGFCGFVDGNPTNDQRYRDGTIYKGNKHEFVEIWEQDKSCSLFQGAKPDNHPIDKKTYCRCVPNSHTYDCGEDFDADPCQPGDTKEVTKTLINNFSYAPGTKACDPEPANGRKKRSVYSEMGNLKRGKRAVPTDPKNEDDVYKSFVFDPSYVYQEPTWPTSSGWTEAKARAYCEDYLLKKDAVKNCKTYLGATYASEINSCIFDIKATDSTTFAASTLNVIIANCLAEVEKEPPNVVDLNGGVKKTTLLSSLCLDNCNGKGTCKEGQCVCNAGFYGSVCSLTKDTPPTIAYIPRDGLCNTRSRNCARSEIFGRDIINSPDLKCRLTPYYPETEVRDDSGQFTTTATFINFNLILCPHNGKIGNFLVALSNNGKDYSKDELLFMAYDSACFECSIYQDDKRGNCTQLKTGCVIGSKCFVSQEVDADNQCKICDPDRNTMEWSLNTELSNCTKDDEKTIAIIAGVSSGVAVILIVVIAVVVHKKCRRGKVSPPSAEEVKSEAEENEADKKQQTSKTE